MAHIDEEIVFRTKTPIQAYIKTNNKSERHWHKNIELIYVLEGRLEIQIKEQTYYLEKDQMILINPYDIHSIKNNDCILTILTIDLSKYDPALVREATLRFDCNSITRQDQNPFIPLKSLIARVIRANSTEDPVNELLNKSLAYAILHHLIRTFPAEIPSDYSLQQNQISRMEEILRYINQHYSEGITLSDLASEFYLTVPYMSKIFKDYIGTTFTEYMNTIRISHAVEELSNPSSSIDMVAEKNGFPNTRSFVAAFKEIYGELPSKYRKNSLGQSASSEKFLFQTDDPNSFHHNYLEILTKYLETPDPLVSLSGTPAQIIEVAPVSVTQKGFHLKHHFRYTTSIGKAKQILFAENQRMLSELQREIGFQYIKFHGILDDDMMVYSELADGTPQLNFVYVDMVIDFLLSINLRPFMQFSFMPKALAKETSRTMFYTESYISMPKDMDKWNFLIRELILHLESRYSSKEVEHWPFSLWNEPDSPEFMFGLGSVEDYFNFYRETYQTVKKCNSNISFGAPSVLPTTIQDGEWMNAFLHLCNENSCVPTFLNFHFYPLAAAANHLSSEAQTFSRMVYQKSPDALRECIYQLKKNAKEYQWNIETIYMMEWNSSISHRELLNDTVFKASYVVKNILDNYDHIDSFGYWTLSDFIEEVKMSGELFHGGLGMFTYNGIKKPPYYAFRLLSKLGNRLIGRGDGYFITKEKECFQIILYNYLHYSDLYASGELFDMTFTNRYTPFPNMKRKKYVIPLADVVNSEYILTETIINREHGSAFDKWAELGALPLETQDDINYLKSVSVPLIKKRRLSVENNRLTVSCELEPFEVRLIEIRAQYQ